MSREMKKVKEDGRSNDIHLVQFAGGERGLCVQLTQRSMADRPDAPFCECIQMTKNQAKDLAQLLGDWAHDSDEVFVEGW